ncbi:hypothetical protein Ddc_13719 [Ditylenchus destructor]|nr:hypothetical protein Ddc_13719 [Ditylenchus destructor]
MKHGMKHRAQPVSHTNAKTRIMQIRCCRSPNRSIQTQTVSPSHSPIGPAPELFHAQSLPSKWLIIVAMVVVGDGLARHDSCKSPNFLHTFDKIVCGCVDRLLLDMFCWAGPALLEALSAFVTNNRPSSPPPIFKPCFIAKAAVSQTVHNAARDNDN